MHHNATGDPHHHVTLRVGDRLKAHRFTADLRAGDLYEVQDFDDVPFPDQHRSTTRLHDLSTGTAASAPNIELQDGFRKGFWTLA